MSTRQRVAIPGPGAADTTGIIERLHIEPELVAHPLQRIQATHAAAGDGNLKFEAVEPVRRSGCHAYQPAGIPSRDSHRRDCLDERTVASEPATVDQPAR